MFFHDLKHFKWSWRALLLFQICPISLRTPLQTISSVLSLCREDTHGNCGSKLCCACLLCFGSQWIRGRVDCRAWDYCVCALEEYLCCVNACLHFAQWAASFAGCRHPCFMLGISYLEDPKQKSHTTTLKFFILFNLLWGLGLQIWECWALE